MSSARLRPAAAAGRSPAIGRWLAAVGVLVALGLLAAWLLGWFGAAVDPRVAEIRQLRADLAATFPADRGPANLAEATTMATAMNGIREKIEALPERLRPEAERGGGNMFRTAMRARIDAYFNAPPAQREAVLDRQIDEMEFMNKAFEAARAVTAVVGGNAGGSAPAASGAGAAGGNGSGPGGSGPGGGGPGGGGPRGPWQTRSEEERNKFRKGIIDRTSPAERARYVEYWRAVGEQRDKRGLPQSPWGR